MYKEKSLGPEKNLLLRDSNPYRIAAKPVPHPLEYYNLANYWVKLLYLNFIFFIRKSVQAIC